MRSPAVIPIPLRLTAVRIRQLQLFNTLSEVGSISEAARRCHVTQSAATDMLKELEKAFATQLLVRGARGVTLTPEGASLARHVTRILNELLQILDDIERARQKRLSLRIGFISVAMDGGLPDIVARLQASRIQSHLSLKELNVQECCNALLAGEIDIAVTANQAAFSANQTGEDIRIHPLGEERYVIAASAAAARRLGPSPDLAALRDQLWILPSRESFLRRTFEDSFLRQGVQPPEAILELSPIALAPDMLVKLDAVALVSERVARSQLPAQGLHVLPDQPLQVCVPLVLAYRAAQEKNRLLQAFRKHAQAMLAPAPGP